MATSLTRDQMVEIIRRGESVLIHGYGVIACVQDLPSETVLAAGDRAREDAALAALEAQLKAKQEELAQAREAVRKRREGQGAAEPPPPRTGPLSVELPRQAPQGPPLPPPPLPAEGLPAACSPDGPDSALVVGHVDPPALTGAGPRQGDAAVAVSQPANPPPGSTVPGVVEKGLPAGADRAVAPAGPAPGTPPLAGPAGRVGADQGGADQDGTLAAAVAEFAAESLDLREGLEAPMEATFDRWVGWCAGRGLAPSTPQHFGRALRSAVPGLEEIRPRTANGGRERRYRGVSLKETAGNG